jgi:hypothetical protein
MAAECSVMLAATVTGLGEEIDIRQKFSTEVPTVATHFYRTLAVADTPEIMELGGIAVSLCDGVLFKAIGNDFWIDTCLSVGGVATDFVSKLLVPSGTAQFFGPPQTTASIAILASTAAAYEIVAVGRV